MLEVDLVGERINRCSRLMSLYPSLGMKTDFIGDQGVGRSSDVGDSGGRKPPWVLHLVYLHVHPIGSLIRYRK